MSRRSLFDVRLTIPVSQETAGQLRRLAAQHEETVSALVRRAIRRLLREAHTEKGP